MGHRESSVEGRDAALGRLLVLRGVLSEEALKEALRRQEAEGGELGEILLQTGAVTPADLIQALAIQLDVDLLRRVLETQGDALKRLPTEPSPLLTASVRLSLLVKACWAAGTSRDLSSLLETITREAALLTGAERATIFLKDEGSQELWSEVALGLERETIRMSLQLGVAGFVVRTGQTVHVPDAYKDPRFHRAIDEKTGFRTRSLLCVPIRNPKEEIIGALEVMNKGSGPFERLDEASLSLLAQQAGITIENVQLYEHLISLRETLVRENMALRRQAKETFWPEGLIGESPKFLGVLKIIEQVAPTQAPVLLEGENGTGKEVLGRAIHYRSLQAEGPFVAINCGAIPESLMESELFGHERGAFTGAQAVRIGHFESAHGGSLFLDEVGDLPLHLQVKLLRVLQTGEVQRLGGKSPRKVDLRILAATNRDLKGEMERGAFREDLYFRLNVIRLEVPPLRERKEDIPLLAHHFVRTYSERMKKPVLGITPQAMDLLLAYEYRGNVRELENLIHRAVILTSTTHIRPEDLPEEVTGASLPSPPPKTNLDLKASKTEAVAWVERQFITDLLQRAKGNISEAARLGQIHRTRLQQLIKKHGVRTEDFKIP